MERLKSLKTVVYLIVAIVLFQIGMLAYMLFPATLFIWLTIGVLLVLLIYLAVLSLGLIKELVEINKKQK